MERPGEERGSPGDLENELLRRIAEGNAEERSQILSNLLEEARQADSVDRWTLLAFAYVNAELYALAANVFDALLHRALDPNERDVHRTSLATTYDSLHFFTSSRHHFDWLRQHGNSEDARALGADQLERLDEEASERAVNDELRRLQFAFARERSSGPQAELPDFERLGRLSVVSLGAFDEIAAAEVKEHLYPAWQSYPDSIAIMRGLLHCDILLRDSEEQHDILRQLEDEEPGSLELEFLSAVVEAGSYPGNFGGWSYAGDSGMWLEGAQHLLAKLEDPEEGISRAALSDLYELWADHPRDRNIAFALAFGFLKSGQGDEVTSLLSVLSELPEETHAYHFNMGQLYAFVDRTSEARAHLRRALDLAETEDDRQDATRQLADRGWSSD